MAKRFEEKDGLEPLIPPPAEPSRERIRGAGDDSDRILRERGQTNRTGGQVNRLLDDKMEAGGVDRRTGSLALDLDLEWPSRISELVRACNEDGDVFHREYHSPIPHDVREGFRGRKPPASVAALVRGLIEEIPGLARSPVQTRRIIELRLAEGMTGEEIADAMKINRGQGPPTSALIASALNTFKENVSEYFNLIETVAVYFDIDGNNVSGFYRLPLPDEPEFRTSDGPDEVRQKRLAALLDAIPLSPRPAEQLQVLDQLNREYRQGIMPRLENTLNARIREMPHATLEDKERLADFVNAELAGYGLAIKCPKSGLPGSLSADVGNWPGVGRFQIRSVSPDGKRHRTSSDTLPNLELVALTRPIEPVGPPVPPEPESSWETKVGPKTDRTGRIRSE